MAAWLRIGSRGRDFAVNALAGQAHLCDHAVLVTGGAKEEAAIVNASAEAAAEE
jgi:hypothetical protein